MRCPARRWRSAALVLSLLVAACSSPAAPTRALFAAHGQGDDFYALPYPNDLRRNADGTLDLSLFPTHSNIADQYRMAAQTLDGFALNAAMFVRFSDLVDQASLSDPISSTLDGASVYLVNVDGNSSKLGEKTPIIAHFRADGTET